MGRRPTGRDASSAAAPPSIPPRGIVHGCERCRAGARCSCARRARRPPRTGRSGSIAVRSVGARGCRPCWVRWCAGSAATRRSHERALSSAGERRPYKAEVVGSIPTAPTSAVFIVADSTARRNALSSPLPSGSGRHRAAAPMCSVTYRRWWRPWLLRNDVKEVPSLRLALSAYRCACQLLRTSSN